MSVVAEGIETEEQLGRLRDLACPFAQGYLFAPPRPAEDVAELLAAGVRAPAPVGAQLP
jgi:EAL domain-containing protein (putative c-di-GMP-specific phosphodiesterase class I)